MSRERPRAQVTPFVDGEVNEDRRQLHRPACAAAGTTRSPTATSTCARGSRCDVATFRTSTRSSRGFRASRDRREARLSLSSAHDRRVRATTGRDCATVVLAHAARFQRRVWRRTDHGVIHRIRRFDRPGSVATSGSIACNGTSPLSAGRCRYRSIDRRRCGSEMRCPAPLRIGRASKRYR